MRVLARCGDPVQVMRAWTWWQVAEYLRATAPEEPMRPELHPETLAAMGVIVEYGDGR